MSNLIKKIQYLYGLENITLNRLNEGYVGENHTLHSSRDKYFFKQLLARSSFDETRIKEICSVYDLMKSHNLTIETPILNNSGFAYSFIEDNFCMLFKMVEGVKFENLEPGNINNAFKSSAESLAKIHKVGSRLPLLDIKKSSERHIKDNFLRKLNEIEEIICSKTKLEEIDELSLDLIKWKRLLFNKGLSIIPEDKKTMIIHGDYHRENLLFDQDGSVKRIFDWDNSVISSNSWEVVYAMMKVCFYDSFDNYQSQIAGDFLINYSNIFPFSKQDLRDGFNYWSTSECLFLWSLRSHYLNNDNKSDRFITNSAAKLKFLNENLEDILSELNKFLF